MVVVDDIVDDVVAISVNEVVGSNRVVLPGGHTVVVCSLLVVGAISFLQQVVS